MIEACTMVGLMLKAEIPDLIESRFAEIFMFVSKRVPYSIMMMSSSR